MLRWFHTIRHLRSEQILFRLWYPVKRKIYWPPAEAAFKSTSNARNSPAQLLAFPEADVADSTTLQFSWLNQPIRFQGTVDWAPSRFGLLWDYHMHSFTWLEGETHFRKETLAILLNYISRSRNKSGLDSYPVSLRVTAWTRWLLRFGVKNETIIGKIYLDAHRLAAFPERHILANHLLENAMGLFHAAVFLDDRQLLERARKWLSIQLREQFLPDGAHYERSVSYHAKMLSGVLKCLLIAPLSSNMIPDDLIQAMRDITARGLGWMHQMQMPDGSFPAFGDSLPHVLPNLKNLQDAAAAIRIDTYAESLGSSGYCTLGSVAWKLVVTCAEPQPAYQPGHAHADALSFCLHAYNRPLIVDSGISIYSRNAIREQERGTTAHNTIVIAGASNSEAWASFRFGRRATVELEEADEEKIIATCRGYASKKINHRRIFTKTGIGFIVEDYLQDSDSKSTESFLHFHPDMQPFLGDESTVCFRNSNAKIKISGAKNLILEPYDWNEDFNLQRPALRLRIPFTGHGIKTEFSF